MFDRFIRLARAKKALREQRFEDALQLALDPVIAVDRRAEQVRTAAGQELLARAHKRLAAGDLMAAKAGAERLRAALGAGPVAELMAAIELQTTGDLAAQQGRRQTLAEAHAAIQAGDLTKVDALVAVHASGGGGEWRQIRAALEARRKQAATAVGQAEHSLAAGSFDAALEGLLRAAMLDRDHPDVLALRARLVADAGAQLRATVQELLANGDVAGALVRHRTVVNALPMLRAGKSLLATQVELQAAVQTQLRACATLDEGVALARSVRASALDLPETVAALVDSLLALATEDGFSAGNATGDPGERLAALAAAAAAAGAQPLAELARTRLAAAHAHGELLTKVRALIDRGELDAARAALTTFLAEQPLHEGARRELELLDQSFADLDRRMAQARSALRAGQLREACTLALALHGSARVTTEAQQLVAEARGRMALVDRGLDEVRVALHGRAAATLEGVRHCLMRIEALAKVQTDHADLGRFAAAVQAEIEALGVCERTAAALDRNALAEVLAGLAELQKVRGRLLSPDRLLARVCDLADRLAAVAEVALAAGRLDEVEQCGQLFAQLQDVRPEFAARAQDWLVRADARRGQARGLVEQARQRLAERDLAEAERLVEAARVQWLGCDEAKRLADELHVLRHQSDALTQVQAMTAERDFHGAQQKLAAMHGPSPFLRTRIYDMKQNLAKAQGLEGAFLLRVDEGGEQLVLRGESVTIGNVRQNRADLPVLANLAGRHASIRRSMSFHGGMQDSVVAEEGEVAVAGKKVKSQPLAHGDRVQLGPALGLVYQRPSGRSLTVGLVLQSGFQVAGTDRVLLMKDRGRDGRILLGAGQDVHVRVAKARGEVEIYATNSGQIRVAAVAGGTIDGVPWKGEHPVAAGQIVEAAGITFQLLPWRPAA